MLKKLIKFLFIFIITICFIYFLGPKEKASNLNTEIKENNQSLIEIKTSIEKEKRNPNIKEGNHSRLIWTDSIPKKTKYSIVYLHGFSASPAETEVIYTNFAKRYGANLYAFSKDKVEPISN